MDADSAPVLIAGGGPVGLTLAIELGHRKVPCLLLEQRDTTTAEPRCTLTNARSMEHFRRLGIAARIRAAGISGDYRCDVVFATRLFGHEICRFSYPSRNEAARSGRQTAFSSRHAAELPQRISQIYLEPVLRAAAESFAGNDVRFGWRVESVEPGDDCVAVRAVQVGSGRRVELRPRWVAACDGGGSAIRARLGIDMLGQRAVSQQVGIFFRAPALRRSNPHGDALFWFVANSDVRGVVVAVDGEELYTLHVRLPAEADHRAVDPAALLRQAAGRDFPFEILAVNPWHAHLMVAEHYRLGRVFLLGDAAHLLIPTGGFGMNTGIGDACDLGWKLAAVLEGWGGPALLDSYETERRPIGERNVAAAADNAAGLASQPLPPGIEDEGEEAAELRRSIGGIILERQRMEFESAGVQLGYRYDPSPICIPDGTPPPPDGVIDYTPTARPGSRAPHLRLADGSLLYDRLRHGFTLLRFASACDTTALERAAALRRVPLTVIDVDDPAARDLYGANLVLVRPDQHVAWRGAAAPQHPLSVIDRIRGAEA